MYFFVCICMRAWYKNRRKNRQSTNGKQITEGMNCETQKEELINKIIMF